MPENCPECGKFLSKYVNDDDHRFEWYCSDEECYHHDRVAVTDPDGYWGEVDEELRNYDPLDPRLPENQALQSSLLNLQEETEND